MKLAERKQGNAQCGTMILGGRDRWMPKYQSPRPSE